MNYRRFALIGLMAPALLVMACDTAPTGVEPERSVLVGSWLSSYSIVDAGHADGSAGFHWLPPVAERGLESNPGIDPSALPLLSVEICEWDGDACVADPVASFDSEDEGIRIATDDDGSDHFVAHWQAWPGVMEPGGSYRIRVVMDDADVGHADAVVAGRRGEAPPANRGDFVVLRTGQTLPIKFLATEELETTTGTDPAGDDAPRIAMVANRFSDDVSVIDVASSAVTATIEVGEAAEPMAIAFSPDGMPYVANHGSNDVSVLDLAAGSVSATIPVGINPRELVVTPDGSSVVVANAGSADLSVIDVALGTVSATIAVCDLPQSVAVGPGGSTAYVACPRSDEIEVVDLDAGEVSSKVAVEGSMPRAVALSPDGGTAYAANFGSDDVSIIDLVTETVTATVGVGSGPISMALTPDGSEVWVTNERSESVSVVDVGGAVESEIVGTGPLPASVGIASDAPSAYVANRGADNVSVIDPSSKAVTATLDVGAAPSSVAVSP